MAVERDSGDVVVVGDFAGRRGFGLEEHTGQPQEKPPPPPEERFPGGQTTSAVAVYHREGVLTDADQQTILSEAEEIAGVEFVLPPVAPFEGDSPEGLVSEDGTTAFTVIPINAARQQDINALIEDVREVANGGSGLTAEVTGPAALETDLRHAIDNEELRLFYQPIVALPGDGIGPEACCAVRHRTGERRLLRRDHCRDRCGLQEPVPRLLALLRRHPQRLIPPAPGTVRHDRPQERHRDEAERLAAAGAVDLGERGGRGEQCHAAALGEERRPEREEE